MHFFESGNKERSQSQHGYQTYMAALLLYGSETVLCLSMTGVKGLPLKPLEQEMCHKHWAQLVL